jgi:hypothetical protein
MSNFYYYSILNYGKIIVYTWYITRYYINSISDVVVVVFITTIPTINVAPTENLGPPRHILSYTKPSRLWLKRDGFDANMLSQGIKYLPWVSGAPLRNDIKIYSSFWATPLADLITVVSQKIVH